MALIVTGKKFIEDFGLHLVIFDLDGTLADIGHRRKNLDPVSPDWKSFNAAMSEDAPNNPVVQLYKTLWSSEDYRLIIVSGRSDEFRAFTERWLVWNEIPFSALFMRKKYDHRPDHIVKEEFLREIRKKWGEVLFVVDDRRQVVDMWRRNGVTCLQCDYGEY